MLRSRLRSRRTGRSTPRHAAHSRSSRVQSGSRTSTASRASRRTLHRCRPMCISMTSTPAAYTPAITPGHASAFARAAKLRRGIPADGRTSAADSARAATGVDGCAGVAGSSTRAIAGPASTAPAAAVRITTAHSGSAIDRIGSRSRPTTASVQTRWRIAADSRRYRTACTSAAAPSSTEALTAIESAADVAGSRSNGIMTCLPVRGRGRGGCSGAGTRPPTAAPTSCRAVRRSPSPASCRRTCAPAASARIGWRLPVSPRGSRRSAGRRYSRASRPRSIMISSSLRTLDGLGASGSSARIASTVARRRR